MMPIRRVAVLVSLADIQYRRHCRPRERLQKQGLWLDIALCARLAGRCNTRRRVRTHGEGRVSEIFPSRRGQNQLIRRQVGDGIS
jgi:hypothetical protein